MPKALLLALLAVTGGLTLVLAYDQLFVEQSFGPSAVLVVSIVGCLFLALLVTFFLSGTRFRETTVRLWLVAISTTASYFLLDLVSGFFLIQPLSPPLVPDEFRHHKLVPNSHSRIQSRDFSYVQRVNNFGLRGRDVELNKPVGTYRILMLGDSFTMGKGVQDNETFSVLLETSLNRTLAGCGGNRVEVLNAGVDGYAPILSFIQLTRELQPVMPDLVVLNLDMNDLAGEAAYRRGAVKGPNGEVLAVPLVPGKASPIDRIRSWSERHLFFTRALLFYVNELFDYRDIRVVVTQANPEVLAHTLSHDTDPREDQWRNLFDSVVKIQTYAEEHGIEFLLTTYPQGHQVNEHEWIPGRYSFVPEGSVVSDRSVDTISQFTAGEGIHFLSLFPDFRAYHGEEALYFPYDGHWTRVGHQVMAGRLEKYMLDRYSGHWCRSLSSPLRKEPELGQNSRLPHLVSSPSAALGTRPKGALR